MTVMHFSFSKSTILRNPSCIWRVSITSTWGHIPRGRVLLATTHWPSTTVRYRITGSSNSILVLCSKQFMSVLNNSADNDDNGTTKLSVGGCGCERNRESVRFGASFWRHWMSTPRCEAKPKILWASATTIRPVVLRVLSGHAHRTTIHADRRARMNTMKEEISWQWLLNEGRRWRSHCGRKQ